MSASYNQDSTARGLRDNTMTTAASTNMNPQTSADYGGSQTDQFDGSIGNSSHKHSTHLESSRTDGRFNDYGITEVGGGGPSDSSHATEASSDYYGVTHVGGVTAGPSDQDNLRTSGQPGGNSGTSAMDHNSGPGNNSGGFDAGSGADARTGYGTSGTSAMDHNSGPGQAGGFDVGSGADTGATAMERTGGNYGTSGMDHNSGPGNSGGGFDAGSGADVGTGTGGYAAGNTTSSSKEYDSENQYDTGSTGAKPSTSDKIKGGAEKLVGKITKNPEMVERGQQRKQGEFSNDSSNNQNL
ncbi:hypothetical protein K438DRAFT_769225 [Mycena galopus ATCC 62051]|nr:hypothetical protein K438DRAFT_769225 [Mycena galopus ATCC 62051]